MNSGQVTVFSLYAAFPNPISAYDGRDGDASYCIGATLVMTRQGKFDPCQVNGKLRFPKSGKIAEAIQWARPQVYQKKRRAMAQTMAEAIIRANDQGDIEFAWSVLSMALTWGGQSKVDFDSVCMVDFAESAELQEAKQPEMTAVDQAESIFRKQGERANASEELVLA